VSILRVLEDELVDTCSLT